MSLLKKLALAAAMAALSMSLCSCGYLDEIRAQRVEVNPDGTLTHGGQTYSLVADYVNYYSTLSGDYCIVVNPDVPLLLTHSYGYGVPMIADGQVVIYGGKVYVSDAASDELKARMANLTFDTFCTQSFDMEQWCYTYQKVDADVATMLNATLAGQMTEGYAYDVFEVLDGSETIYRSDGSLGLAAGFYQLYEVADGYVLQDDYRGLYYLVPQEYHATCAKFMSLYAWDAEATAQYVADEKY